MFALTLLLVLLVGETYEQAVDRSIKEDKPLVVVIGATWCGPCQRLKQEVIEPMKQSGEFDSVVLVQVDYDEKPDLCKVLMAGSKDLPKIYMFRKGPDGWKKYTPRPDRRLDRSLLQTLLQSK